MINSKQTKVIIDLAHETTLQDESKVYKTEGNSEKIKDNKS